MISFSEWLKKAWEGAEGVKDDGVEVELSSSGRGW